ncbi:MAG TPA: flavin reductase family protein [Nocardioidaceae bacterium]|nr:flavin reductase family protein [Nocardioidaceae bacterium]
MDAEQGQSVGVDEFSRFVDGLDYPLFVVTTAHSGERSGCLVGFTTQVSIDPPQMLVCISEKNHTHRLARDADLVAVHLLSPGQQELAVLFGEETGDETDKFAQCSWHAGPDGVPVLDDAPRHMVGRVLQRVPFADHLGLLLEPVAVSVGQGPVAYSLEDAADMEPGHPA